MEHLSYPHRSLAQSAFGHPKFFRNFKLLLQSGRAAVACEEIAIQRNGMQRFRTILG